MECPVMDHNALGDRDNQTEDTWNVLASEKLNDVNKFWNGIQILHRNIHSALPNVSASVVMIQAKVLYPFKFDTMFINNFTFLENATVSDISEQLKCLDGKIQIVQNLDFSSSHEPYVTVHKLIPRNPQSPSNWLYIFMNHASGEVVFQLFHHDSEQLNFCSIFPFKLAYLNGEIKLKKSAGASNDSINWLKKTFFQRILKWTDSAVSNHSSISSNSLIPVDEYARLYYNLKMKYGTQIVKIWPENTDPQKFVYEDVAIATYLLILWKKQREEVGRPEWKQSFIDLGCGNGLLVYILSSEGHEGKGLDVRKRKIWDYYPQTTQLQVDTITPSDTFLFPFCDWIIGNHSDELTPWIPVIAARSSFKCSFFLLPCCCYDFSGTKYQRKNSMLSQYSDYLDYVESICKVCGFETQRDRLRIPSTKRICIVGMQRMYAENEEDKINKQIADFINARTNHVLTEISEEAPSNTAWISEFKSRPSDEKVRNCTKINSSVKDQIVRLVTCHLLETKRLLSVPSENGGKRVWNAGGIINISEIAAAIPHCLLQQLKKECGGLQTLLKNNHSIFAVVQGKVQFREPGMLPNSSFKNNAKKRKSNSLVLKYKVKPCWFHINHPDGCPLTDTECSFKH